MTAPSERQRRRELFIVIMGIFAVVLAILLLSLYWWGV